VHIYYEGELKNSQEQCYPSLQVFTCQSLLVASGGTYRDGIRFSLGKCGIFKFILSPLLLGTGQYYFSPRLASYDTQGDVRSPTSFWLDFHDCAYCLHVKGVEEPTGLRIIEHPFTWQHSILKQAAVPKDAGRPSTIEPRTAKMNFSQLSPSSQPDSLPTSSGASTREHDGSFVGLSRP
jgi:hypothetical protein